MDWTNANDLAVTFWSITIIHHWTTLNNKCWDQIVPSGPMFSPDVFSANIPTAVITCWNIGRSKPHVELMLALHKHTTIFHWSNHRGTSNTVTTCERTSSPTGGIRGSNASTAPTTGESSSESAISPGHNIIHMSHSIFIATEHAASSTDGLHSAIRLFSCSNIFGNNNVNESTNPTVQNQW